MIALGRLCLGNFVLLHRVSNFFLGFLANSADFLCRSISTVFRSLYNFNSGQIGTVFLTMVLVLISYAMNIP